MSNNCMSIRLWEGKDCEGAGLIIRELTWNILTDGSHIRVIT